MGDINFSIDTGVVEALKRVLRLEVFVETGTFEGDAIEIARPYFDVVHSIELSPEYYEHARLRFKQDKAVHLYLGDSGKKLADLRPVFKGKSALFWLDAHWCVAQDTGGEKSQCPLLEEIRAIGALNEDSVIIIDDARLFASPPPQPHEISQWPRLDQVIDALRAVGPKTHELKIFNDVIVFAPLKANQALTDYMTRHTVTLLKIKDKADGYDILDAQLKEKHAEITALKKAAVEKDTEISSLKKETNTKDKEIASLKGETNTKDKEIASLKSETNTKDKEIASLKSETNTKDKEIASLKTESNTKDKEIASLKSETDGKDGEISSLKKVSNEREQLIFTLDGHVKAFQKIVAEQNAVNAAKDQQIAALNRELEQGKIREAQLKQLEAELRGKFDFQQARLDALPPDVLKWGDALVRKDDHIRNIETFLQQRDAEIAQLRGAVAESQASVANAVGGLAHLEIAKFYGRQLSEKEAVMQDLKRACDEREALIQRLCLEATGVGPRLGKLWTGLRAHYRMKIHQPFSDWLFRKVVEKHWMQIGILRQYDPRPIKWDKFPKARLPVHRLPTIGIVTPSYNQQAFVGSTILSVLNQNYPRLRYVVQDGASTDGSAAVIATFADRLHFWESVKDRGQGDAIRRGFDRVTDLGPDDIMCWLNSDDFINPRALRHVAEYFATHPKVDAVYGNRIIIDENDREIGRWVMPPHDPKTLEWIDYIPQETLFFRKRIWDRAGGVDAEFQFALDWDLLMRFATAQARIVRLPYFLGCFRVHAHQKTSQHIHSIGNDEMTKIRTRLHPHGINPEMIHKYARKARFWGAVCSRLAESGIRL
jgi:Glycosyl transferase family 2